MAKQTLESVESIVEEQLNAAATELERLFAADVLAIYGPITPGLDEIVRDVVERFKNRAPSKTRLCVVLQTLGGVVELAERIVNVFRHHYADVEFVVPDRAMSAGTVLVMSGDEIWMDYFSCLGPIDPQLQREGSDRFVPALGYLSQYKRLIEKSKAGELTEAEFLLLQKFDLAELHQFEEARELSTELLVRWLAKYKFKKWTQTETRRQEVTDEMRRARAREIADKLSNNELWHSHSRGIPMKSLVEDLGLRISDFGADEKRRAAIRRYHRLMMDSMRIGRMPGFVHPSE